jgi:hypothetical protein
VLEVDGDRGGRECDDVIEQMEVGRHTMRMTKTEVQEKEEEA